MIFGFDVISDLNLTEDSIFDWSGKPTSLYCVVAGNISRNLITVHRVLRHLGKHYQGVFYIEGGLEYNGFLYERDNVVKEIHKICDSVKNAVFLHNNVVVIDGVALIGINGWYGNYIAETPDDKFQVRSYRYEDMIYLEKTIERLQLHVDVRKIVVISSSVPSDQFYFGSEHAQDPDLYPSYTLHSDTENKVTNWIFGSTKKEVDITLGNVNYLNNPCFDKKPYYPKRFQVEI